LFTRYTMVSASVSIIPEFQEKIELMGLEDYFDSVGNEITNKRTGSKIIFKGLHTSSGSQTAAIKSIHGITIFVLDEAEEMPDKATFDKIDFSVRVKGVQNMVVLVYNSPAKSHWIYKTFYKPYGYTVPQNTITDDSVYIYTTYFDNYDNLDETFLAKAAKLRDSNKEDDKTDYNCQFLGFFADARKGQVYKDWLTIPFKSFPDLPFWYAIDFGFSNSKNAIVRVYWDADNNTVYFHQVDYQTGRKPNDISEIVKNDYGDNDGLNNVWIIGDNARPEVIGQLCDAGLNAIPCIKGKNSVSKQIKEMREIKVIYSSESYGITHETENYVYAVDKASETGLKDEPIKAYDDLMDACRYGFCTPKKLNWIQVLTDN